jgi:hypothetical protein
VPSPSFHAPGYLSEDLLTKLANNTGILPECDSQFKLSMQVASRNHHKDVNHEDFLDCLRVALGASPPHTRTQPACPFLLAAAACVRATGHVKLPFEERLEKSQALKALDEALVQTDFRHSGVLPETDIRRLGSEFGVHKMLVELAIITSGHGVARLIK